MSQQIDDRGGWTSASNAEADLLCPARHLAQKSLPASITPPATSRDAQFGDKIHAALAKRDPSGLSVDEFSTYEACLKIEVESVRKFFGPEADLSKAKSWPETRFWIKFGFEVPSAHPSEKPRPIVLTHSAKPDRVYRLDNRILIIEYKTLKGDIPASPRNLQVRDQAVICAGHFMVDEVGGVVIQPLITHTPEICLYQAADLARGRDELSNRVRASNDPRSQRVAGEVQCKFCLAKLSCVEHQRWAGSMVPNMLSILEVPVTAWTPEQRKIFCDRVPVAQKWLDECWEAMEAGLASDPSFVPGYVLKPGNKREEIKDPAKVFSRFNALGGKPEQFMGAVKVTKTGLREALFAVTALKGKKLDEKLKELCEGVVEVKQNKPSMVKSSEAPEEAA